MQTNRRPALAALTAAGLLWGTTVPLSKLALQWLPPGWLTVVRFGVAAVILLLAVRSRVRAAFSPALLASGAVGYGGTVLLQNAGITRTSVSHAALLIGTAPIMVAIIAAVWQRSVARPVAWAGFAVSLAGVGLVAAGGGGSADLAGDGMVLASVLMSAGFTVTQTRLLNGRDPVAVTAVQFLGAALVALPFSLLTEGMPAAPARPGAVLVVLALAAGGTLLPFSLFAYGQSRLPAEIAGAFLNIEPLVGAVAGVVIFGDPAGPAQLGGGAAIIGGIALSSFRRPASWRVPGVLGGLRRLAGWRVPVALDGVRRLVGWPGPGVLSGLRRLAGWDVPVTLSGVWPPADRSIPVTLSSLPYPARQEFSRPPSRPHRLPRRENPLLSALSRANPDLRSSASLHTSGRCGRNPHKEIYEGTNAAIHGSGRWRADGWAGRGASAGQHVHRAVRRHAQRDRLPLWCLALRDRSRQPTDPRPEPHLRGPAGERAGRALRGTPIPAPEAPATSDEGPSVASQPVAAPWAPYDGC
jgi:O-acetylserine/cysteine efflux transporter